MSCCEKGEAEAEGEEHGEGKEACHKEGKACCNKAAADSTAKK